MTSNRYNKIEQLRSAMAHKYVNEKRATYIDKKGNKHEPDTLDQEIAKDLKDYVNQIKFFLSSYPETVVNCPIKDTELQQAIKQQLPEDSLCRVKFVS